jgi:hypothetical protein
VAQAVEDRTAARRRLEAAEGNAPFHARRRLQVIFDCEEKRDAALADALLAWGGPVSALATPERLIKMLAMRTSS